MARAAPRFSLPSPNVDDGSLNQSDRDEFVRRLMSYERMVHAYIYSLVPNWTAAEEILQDTYVQLFQKIGEWDPSKDLFAWIRAFAHYQVLTYCNRVRRDKLQFSQDFLEKVAATHAAEPEASSARLDALEQCLDQLDPRRRELLNLAYQGDVSLQEVAERSQRTVSATYQVLSRIRKILRECIERTLRNLE